MWKAMAMELENPKKNKKERKKKIRKKKIWVSTGGDSGVEAEAAVVPTFLARSESESESQISARP